MHTEPNPLLVFDTMSAYQRSAALKAAVDLDLFTAISTGHQTAAALAEHCRASERGIRILCDFLSVLEFLSKEGSRYMLSPTAAAFLDRSSPAYIGSAVGFLNSPFVTGTFADVAAAVRKGGTVIGSQGSLDPEHPIWVDFAHAMGPMAGLVSELVAIALQAGAGKRWKVLDVAAGHGLFGITLAKHNPNSEIVAQDWPNVLRVAEENARAAGVATRFSILPGSAFEVDFGGGYDLVLLTNFLHHFDIPTCEDLLRKVRHSMAPEGRAVAVEFVPNEDRVSPPAAAMFSLVMLTGTPGGDAYTFSEYQRMFANAGFSRCELHQLVPSPQQMLIAYKSGAPIR